MKKFSILAAVATLVYGASLSIAYAQKGIGESVGIARQAVKPAVVPLAGTVRSMESGPCQMTTGRSGVGTHIMLETLDGKTLNVHLGPTGAVKAFADQMKVGSHLDLMAFRTEKMPENHYVAQMLQIGETKLTLRDESLRPVWAGAGQRPNPAPAGWGGGLGWGRGAGRPANLSGSDTGDLAGWYCWPRPGQGWRHGWGHGRGLGTGQSPATEFGRGGGYRHRGGWN